MFLRQAPRRERLVTVLAVAAAAVAVLLVLPPAAQQRSEASTSGHSLARDTPASRSVVVVGVPGLVWSQVDPVVMPRLWSAVEGGGAATLSVRATGAVTCPAEAWVTLGAGRRAVASRSGGDALCGAAPATPEPERDPAGGWAVPGQPERVAANVDGDFGAVPGVLASTVREAGGCTAAAGPRAALAAADRAGRLDRYAPAWEALGDAAATGLLSCSLATVQVDPLLDATSPEGVAAALAHVDASVGRVLDLAPDGATVMVLGVADTGGEPALHVAVETGSGVPSGALVTRSTRQPGLVQLVDVAPTVLERLGLTGDATPLGAAWHARPDGAVAAARVAELRDASVAATAHRRVTADFFTFLLVGQLVLYGVAAVALRGRRRVPRRRVPQALRVVALAGAAVPASSYLAMLVPWWRSGQPLLALVTIDLACALVVAGLALALGSRRSPLAPVAVVGAVSAGVLAVDVLTGSHLQTNSPAGYSPLVAGRFYGFGNVGFAVFATGLLVALAGLAHLLARLRWRRRRVTAAVAFLGAAGVGLTGWSGGGADLGGVLALVPGAALLVLRVAGRRVTARIGAAIGVLAVAAVTALAGLDYLRPAPDRTHLGRFVADLVAGDAAPVLRRKAGANLDVLLGNPLALLLPVAVLFVALVLLRPTTAGPAALRAAFARVPLLRTAFTAVLVTAVVGFAVNDSGVVVPATALMVAVPMATAAAAHALPQERGVRRRRDVLAADDPGPGRAEEPAPPRRRGTDDRGAGSRSTSAR